MSVTRRSILRALGMGGAASIGGLAAPSGAHAFPFFGRKKKADALALIGDRWHSYDYIYNAFQRTFGRDMGMTLDCTSNYDVVTRDNLKQYDMIIMLMDGMTWPNGYRNPYHLIPNNLRLESDPPVEDIDEHEVMWMQFKDGDPFDRGKVIQEFVQDGGGLICYHNTHYNAGVNENFRATIGANFIGHTMFRPFRMEVTKSDHPIARGVNDFTITEEQHFLVYDNDPANVFMRSRDLEEREYNNREYGNRGTTCEAGWAHDYGKGRVVFLTPGHTIVTLWNPEFVKMQHNAIKWLLHQT